VICFSGMSMLISYRACLAPLVEVQVLDENFGHGCGLPTPPRPRSARWLARRGPARLAGRGRREVLPWDDGFRPGVHIDYPFCKETPAMIQRAEMLVASTIVSNT